MQKLTMLRLRDAQVLNELRHDPEAARLLKALPPIDPGRCVQVADQDLPALKALLAERGIELSEG